MFNTIEVVFSAVI